MNAGGDGCGLFEMYFKSIYVLDLKENGRKDGNIFSYFFP
jgi:hypothetical protein